MEKYETSTVMTMTARMCATDSEKPACTSSGVTSSASVVAPNDADRKPENVTPICPAERKRFGSATSRATVAPRRLRAASPWT